MIYHVLNYYRSQSTNPFESNSNFNQRQLQEQRIREIQDRALLSSERSLGRLYEAEEMGAKTAEELARQREQLEKTNRQLDEMKATLSFSQKQINGIKSIFGSLKNHFSGQKNYSPAQSSSAMINEEILSSAVNATPDEKYSHHPTTRLRNDDNQGEQKQQTNAGTFNQRLENNLTDISQSLSRLHGMAIGLNLEIDQSNGLIDKIDEKVDISSMQIRKLNTDMKKLL